jgi:hypothetical protein
VGQGRLKYLCPLCARMRYEDSVVVCRQCAAEHFRLHHTYMEIIRIYPELRTLAMPEVFERLWQHFKRSS